jgi:hypothetical protein
MFPLDPRTIERLADLIVDIGGPYERHGWELERLLEHSGWPVPATYDGSSRVPWLVDQLVELRGDRAAIERLLCRVCDPVEYDDGNVTAEAFRNAINEKLAAEQLAVTLVGGRPVIGEGADHDSLAFSEPPDFERRIRGLLCDQQTADALARRITETRVAQSGGAHTLALIGIGSIVEGLLLALLLERDEDVRRNGIPDTERPGKRVPADFAPMKLLIDIAHQRGWIQLDAKNFMHTVRDFRNFVHPRKEWTHQPDFDGDSVRLCWAPVHAIINDLEQRLSGKIDS